MFRRFTSRVAALAIMLPTTVALAILPSHAVPGDPIIPTSPSCVVALVPGSGDPSTAPPAPTCYDPSGADLDEFLVPPSTGPQGVAYFDGSFNPYKSDAPNSTRGASQVRVQSMYFDAQMGFVNGHAWDLTFNTAVTATPGPNGYWVEVGACISDEVRVATAYFRNDVAGGDGRYVGYVLPTADGGADGVSVATQPALRVLDGATVAIPLRYDAARAGLIGGVTYQVKYTLIDSNSLPNSGAGTKRIGGTVSVNVPTCRPVIQPPTQGVKPKAKISLVKKGRTFDTVKVVMGDKKAAAPTRYKVIRDPKRGRTLKKAFTVTYKVKYYKVPKGTVVKVRYKSKTARFPA